MVDDGTGTSAILEVFLKMYETGLNKKLKNRMRFAWWGAEELGLMGSRHYCRELSKNADEMKQIAMYSNHDMLGAPNYIPYIHNGATAPDSVRTASTQITELYASYFATLSRSSKFFNNYALDAMTGGSDYYSFLEISVPAGGLATGAGSIKTMKERSKYGGLANAAYDPCYHQKCDSIENVNFEVLEVLTRSVAHAVERTGSMPNLRQWLGSAQ
jgi:Zn-dependent M28 family amino/carboxypeptidase